MFIVSAVVIGCNPAERPIPETVPNETDINRNRDIAQEGPLIGNRETIDDRTLTENRNTTDNNFLNEDNLMQRDNQRNTGNREGGKLTERADRIADKVEELDQVNNATVVITENTVLVGIDMDRETKGELSADIKEEVEDAVQSVDRQIDRVAVTADPDIFTRIENVANNIGEGRPLSGFGQEIEEIIRRIIPNA